MNRHLFLLTLCQGLFLTNNVVFIAINGLVGLSLAPVAWMATLPIMSLGVVLNLLCIGVALSGIELEHFLLALFALGVGWNFLYTGGTTLLTSTYRPEEKNKVQGAMDFCVFSTLALTSFASGALVTTQGWVPLNLGSLLPLALITIALAWWAVDQRRALPTPA